MFLKIKKSLQLFCLLILGLNLLSSCIKKDEFKRDAVENYNALWRIIDEHYAFLDSKLPADSTWQDMYDKYRPLVNNKMSEDSLFNVMTRLLGELNDGHVNLVAPFDYAYYHKWKDKQAQYYRSSLIENYLDKKYRIAGALYYKQISYNKHSKDSIGYIRCTSFNYSLSQSNILASLSRLSKCRALIIDIRNNGGGSLSNSDKLASFFTPENRVVGYTRYKTGKGHNDFSAKQDIISKAGRNGIWKRPVVVLTDCGVYSAANDFVLKMKGLKHVLILGGKTGGGGGLPMSSELPNGWSVRYSSTQTFDIYGQSIEEGIQANIEVKLSPQDIKQGKDTLIETAIQLIKKIYKDPVKGMPDSYYLLFGKEKNRIRKNN